MAAFFTGLSSQMPQLSAAELEWTAPLPPPAATAGTSRTKRKRRFDSTPRCYTNPDGGQLPEWMTDLLRQLPPFRNLSMEQLVSSRVHESEAVAAYNAAKMRTDAEWARVRAADKAIKLYSVPPSDRVRDELLRMVQNSPEWHAERRGAVGASTLGALCGWSCKGDSSALYFARLIGAEPHDEPDADSFGAKMMSVGSNMEDTLRAVVACWAGPQATITEEGMRCSHDPELPFLRVSLDGVLRSCVHFPDDELIPVEFKVMPMHAHGHRPGKDLKWGLRFKKDDPVVPTPPVSFRPERVLQILSHQAVFLQADGLTQPVKRGLVVEAWFSNPMGRLGPDSFVGNMLICELIIYEVGWNPQLWAAVKQRLLHVKAAADSQSYPKEWTRPNLAPSHPTRLRQVAHLRCCNPLTLGVERKGRVDCRSDQRAWTLFDSGEFATVRLTLPQMYAAHKLKIQATADSEADVRPRVGRKAPTASAAKSEERRTRQQQGDCAPQAAAGAGAGAGRA
jgi:hypothetical protein